MNKKHSIIIVISCIFLAVLLFLALRDRFGHSPISEDNIGELISPNENSIPPSSAAIPPGWKGGSLNITKKVRETLPDVPIAKEITLPGYTPTHNVSQRISYGYPAEFEKKEIDSHRNLYMNGNTTLYFEYMEPKVDSYNGFVEASTAYVSTLKKQEYLYDGKPYEVFTLDERPYEEININGRTVRSYNPKVQYFATDYSKYIDPEVMIFTTSLDGQGIILYGISMDIGTFELKEYLTNMLSTLSRYTPSKTDSTIVLSTDWFEPAGKSNVSFQIPEGWRATLFHGLYFIEPAENGGYYDGARIIFYADNQKQFSDRHGSLYYYLLPVMAREYLEIDDYSEEELEVNSYVQEYNIDEKVQGKEGMSYRLVDAYVPLNNRIESLIPSNGDMVYSYDFEFMSNDIPVMLKFVYTPNNESGVLDMIEKIMSTIKVE